MPNFVEKNKQNFPLFPQACSFKRALRIFKCRNYFRVKITFYFCSVRSQKLFINTLFNFKF